MPNNSLAPPPQVGAPSSGKSWIRQVLYFRSNPFAIAIGPIEINYRPQTKLRECNDFTPVCDSHHRGCTPPRQTPPRQTPPRQTPPRQTPPSPRRAMKRVVRIILECIEEEYLLRLCAVSSSSVLCFLS